MRIANKLKLRNSRASTIVLSLLVIAIIVIPAYITVEAWQLLAAFALLFILTFYWQRVNYRRMSDDKEIS